MAKIENVYLVPGVTDLRKSIDGCSNIVQYQMFLDPFSLLYLSSAIESVKDSHR